MERMNFIAGEWVGSIDGRTYQRENPAAPAIFIGSFPDSAPADGRRAAAAARKAFDAWAATPAQRRAEIIAAAAGLLRERSADIAGKLDIRHSPACTTIRILHLITHSYPQLHSAHCRGQGHLLSGSKSVSVVSTPDNYE